MSDVKLFRVTEFAQSTFTSPQAHKNAIHPVWVMLIIAAWVATIGHWPLWNLFLQPESQVTPLLMVYFAVQWMAASLLIMSLLCWRWTFKIAVTLLVFWAALGACEMITLAESGRAIGVTPRTLMAFLLQSDNWALLVSRITLFTLLHGAVVPAALLWTGTLRRIPFNQNLTINAIILIASYGLLLLTRGLIGHAIPSVIDPLAIFQAP